jgi:3-oxoacyl-[acyl-carrier protein] reductase
VNLVLVARRAEKLAELRKTLTQRHPDLTVDVVDADLAVPGSGPDLASKVSDLGRTIDILVNNAGVGKNGTINTLTTADYDWMMNTNMRSSWLCTKAFLPDMLARRRGSLLFVSSVAGLAGLPNEPIYCATKFAQIGFAQSLDYECYPRNVRVSVIAPGGTDTPFGFYNGTRQPGDPRLAGFHAAEDVAGAVVFAVAQPARSRVFMVWMRPMNESLGTGGGADFQPAAAAAPKGTGA